MKSPFKLDGNQLSGKTFYLLKFSGQKAFLNSFSTSFCGQPKHFNHCLLVGNVCKYKVREGRKSEI